MFTDSFSLLQHHTSSLALRRASICSIEFFLGKVSHAFRILQLLQLDLSLPTHKSPIFLFPCQSVSSKDIRLVRMRGEL